MTVTLWHIELSHYNEKVRWALDYKGIPHVRRALGASYLPRALWASGQPRLPILFLDGRAVADSTRIITALEAYRPEPALYPRDADARARALALEDFFDEGLGPAVRTALLGPAFARDPAVAIRVITTGMPPVNATLMRAASPLFRAFYRSRHAITAETVAASRSVIAAALDRIEAELGDRDHLVGEAFSVADLTAASMLAVLVAPPEMQYPPPAPLPPEITAYRDELAGRRALRWARDVYRRYRGRSQELAA